MQIRRVMKALISCFGHATTWCQVSLSATQQLCAAGALVTLLHREGAIAAPLEDVGPGSRHLLAVNSIAEVLHAKQTLLPLRCRSVVPT